MHALNSYRVAVALLLITVSVVYTNALGASFQFDDFNVIVNYSAVHSLRAWFDALPGIRPLLKLSYTLNWIIDPRAFGFHLFNVGCHLLSTLLVFQIARGICRDSPHVNAIACVAAMLFALHPAQTEAVTYISGRSVALMGVFYLAAVCVGMSECARVRYCAPLFFIAALLMKETAWTLPFALLLIHRLRGLSWRECLQRTHALWGALLIGAAIIVATPAYRRMLAHVFSIRSPLDNVALQVHGWWYLVTQPLLLQTNIDPDVSFAPTFDAVWWLRAAIMTGSAVVLWFARARWLRFALLWFALHLLPTNSLLPRNDIVNDRQLYLALIGPALAIAYVLAVLRTRDVLRAGLVMLLWAICGVSTWQRNADYRDEIALWEATARSSPHKPRVWNNLGYAYQIAGRRDDAMIAYEHALALDANHERALINLRLLKENGAAYP